jgi:hypothetical protein
MTDDDMTKMTHAITSCLKQAQGPLRARDLVLRIKQTDVPNVTTRRVNQCLYNKMQHHLVERQEVNGIAHWQWKPSTSSKCDDTTTCNTTTADSMECARVF